MSLQDEVRNIVIAKTKPVYGLKGVSMASEHDMEQEIVGYVLDAATETAENLMDPQGYVPYWRFRDAINKLRDKP